VFISTAPLKGAVHRYQTVWLVLRVSTVGGSPLSSVAATFVPFAEAEKPLTTCALAKLSLGGPWGEMPAASAILILGFVTPLPLGCPSREDRCSAG
jgi:hypothetical protein